MGLFSWTYRVVSVDGVVTKEVTVERVRRTQRQTATFARVTDELWKHNDRDVDFTLGVFMRQKLEKAYRRWSASECWKDALPVARLLP